MHPSANTLLAFIGFVNNESVSPIQQSSTPQNPSVSEKMSWPKRLSRQKQLFVNDEIIDLIEISLPNRAVGSLDHWQEIPNCPTSVPLPHTANKPDR